MEHPGEGVGPRWRSAIPRSNHRTGARRLDTDQSIFVIPIRVVHEEPYRVIHPHPSTKLAGIIPSSAQAPGARGGLGTPGRRGRTEACAKTAQTSTCIHTKRRVALYRFGHSSVPCRQRPIPHPAGPSIADFEETQPSHMQAQWSPRKPVGRTPNVILAKSCAHQEAARRSIKNSTISDSIVRGRALTWPCQRPQVILTPLADAR